MHHWVPPWVSSLHTYLDPQAEGLLGRLLQELLAEMCDFGRRCFGQIQLTSEVGRTSAWLMGATAR